MVRLVYLLLRQQLNRWRRARREAAPAPPHRLSRRLAPAAVLAAAGGIGVLVGLEYPRLIPPPGFFQPAGSKAAQLEIRIDSIDAPPLVAYLETAGASVSAAATPRDRKARLTSINNTFQPQFQVAPLATTLEVGNEDPVSHNTHLYDGRYTLFNVATPTPGLRVQKVLGRAGMYHVRCDLHPWMRAWIFVPANPHYRVLWQPGPLIVTGIAPGRYRLHLWEPARGEITRTVDFAPGETKSLALAELHQAPGGS